MLCGRVNLYRVAFLLVAAANTINALSDTAWSCEAGSASLAVYTNASYSVSVNNITWLDDGDVAIHYLGPAGPWVSLSAGTLTPVGPGAASSGNSPVLGAYVNYTVEWSTPAASFPFTTTFTCYTDAGALTFSQSYPLGSNGQNTATYNESAPSPSLFDSFNISMVPTAHFPSFAAGAASALSQLGYVEWAGEFSWHYNNFGVGVGVGVGGAATGHMGSGAKYMGGQIGGPVVLHDPVNPRSAAVVVGPLDGFKDVMLALVDDPTGSRPTPSQPHQHQHQQAQPQPQTQQQAQQRWVFGPQGHLAELPAGYTATVALVAPSAVTVGPISVFPRETGVTAAVYSYGALLRTTHNTTRLDPTQDIGVTFLSYWSDNGQVYDGDYWGQAGKNGTAGSVFVDLAATYAAAGVPVQSVQLDPYWFARGYPGNGNWTAAPEVWGPGAAGFADMLAAGVRPTLYSFFWAVGPANTFTDFTWVDGWADTFIHGSIGRVAANNSYAFYTELMRRCRLWACVGFEIDFLDFTYFALHDALTQPGLHAAFMAGLSSAAVAAAVPVQLCMPVPSDVLLSVTQPGVTNIRASDDNDLTYAPAQRWKIGLTSLLHGAVGVKPFFDGTWTYPHYTGADAADVPYPSWYTQNATELGIAISLLSTGPVGLGDKANFTNATLARMACAANGVLLKPSLPAAPMDLFWAYNSVNNSNSLQAAGSEVWQAHSFVPLTYAPTAADTAVQERARLLRAAAQAGAVVDSRGLRTYTDALHARDAETRAIAPGAGAAGTAVTAVGLRGGSTVDPSPQVQPCPFTSLLVIDTPASAPAVVAPGDFTPSLSVTASSGSSASSGSGSACAASGLAAGGYVGVPWSPGTAAMAQRCAAGAPASRCITVLSEVGVMIVTGVAANQGEKGALHPFEILSLSPVLPSGWALLGELGKFTRVAPVRFRAVSGSGSPGGAGAAAPTLSFLVAGEGETVQVALLAPAPSGQPTDGAIVSVAVPFPAAGATVHVSCTGNTATGTNCTQQAV